MQWYFLFLVKDESGQESAEQYLDHFTARASRAAGHIRLAARHVDRLAPEESFHYVFVPVLVSSFEGLQSTISWTKTTFDTFRGDLRRSVEKVKQLKDLYQLSSELTKREAESVAKLIHDLLDRLPIFGTFMLDAVLDEGLFDQLDVKGSVPLYGALLRLWKWHHTPLLGGGARFAPWRELLSIGEAPVLSSQLPLWRGLAKVGNGAPFGHFEIEWSGPSAEPFLGVGASHQELRPLAQDNLLWSCAIEVLDEFDSESLPAHLLCPVPLRLVTKSACVSKASKFLAYCIANPERCAVVRLSYWDVCDLKSGPPQCTSRTWRTAVQTGQWLQDPAAQEPSGSLHFVLIPHRSSVMLLPLQKLPPAPVLSLSFACSRPGGSYAPIAPDEQLDCQLIQGIPLVSATSIFSSVQQMNTAFLAPPRDFLGDKGRTLADATGFGSASWELSISLADLVVDSTAVSAPASERSNLSSLEKCQLSEVIGDPSDWPERRALLLSSADMAKLSDNSTMTRSGSAPKTIAVSAKDILRFFDELGNAKRPPLEAISYERGLAAPSVDKEQLKIAEWPRCLQCRYHDVYYNVDSKSYESCGQFVGERTPLDETATTCIPNRASSVLAIAEVTASAASSCGSSPIPRKSGRKTSSTAPVGDSVPSGADELRRSPRKKCTVIAGQRTTSSRLRRSPRKAAAEKSATGRLQQVTQAKSPRRLDLERVRRRGEMQAPVASPTNPNSSAATRKLRLKLRVAVANALEQNGVPQRSLLFKSCGKKLFAICWTFAEDLVGSGRVSRLLQNIADAHVKQVVEFERLKCGFSDS
ncbi:mdm2-binding protein isoform X1 [Ixodes scapularis]|uniref:mdm2-binding protein isoform X1 n=1 Tax=Ixodes scapularis TaxID=6945 RepID=UPI001C383E05|nr:mdm2-binding protein isoform X1 [Ixodes scapularis]